MAERLKTLPLLLVLPSPLLQNAWSPSSSPKPMQAGHSVVDRVALVFLKLKLMCVSMSRYIYETY